MAAIRMETDKNITVLIDPWKEKMFGDIAKGVYLTRNYINASGILPEEHIFISGNKNWFYWLGYYDDWKNKIPNTQKYNKEIEKVINYIDK